MTSNFLGLLRIILMGCGLGWAAITGLGAVLETGSLEGKLTDWHSLPLAQATVIARNLTTGATARAVTGKNGSYRLAGLGPGEYRLEAEVSNLGKGSVEGILISAGHATRVQAALVMEQPKFAVQFVELDGHSLDPVTPAVMTMISSEELSSVPAIERNWQNMGGPTATGQPKGEIAEESQGQPGSDAEATSSIDGIESAQAFSTGNYRRRSSLGESAVLTLEARSGNSPADSGLSRGASFNLVTAHGSKGLHGQAFFLTRQSLWAARNPFTQWVRPTAAATATTLAQFTPTPFTPENSEQTFGFGIGSNLKRSKILWFASLDGLLHNDPAVATVRHPDKFFAQPSNEELQVLGARLGLPGPAFVEQEVAAYSDVLGQLAGLLGPVPRSIHQVQGFARLDWQMSERQHLSLEGSVANLNAPSGALGSSSETYGNHSFGNSQASEFWGLAKLDSFLTPNLLSALALQFRRHVQSDTAQTPSAFEAPLLANGVGQLPQIVADSKYGFILGKPARLGGSKYPDERSWLAQNTLSWVRGQHLVKAGASFDHISDATDTLINATGTYSYADVLNFASDVASFAKYGINGVDNPYQDQHNCDATGRVHKGENGVLGLGYLPCYAWFSQRIGPADWKLSTNDLAAFTTEQWQVFRGFTLSAGFRVEAEQLPPPITSVKNPDLPATQRLPGTAFEWGPRLGLAWSAAKGTVLRVGAGLYFGRINNSTVLAALTQTGSTNGDLNFLFKPTTIGAPPFPYVFSTHPLTATRTGAVAFAPRFRPQEIDQAVVSLEQSLPSHWVVSVSAMASLGRRLPVLIDTNLNSKASPSTITYDVVDPLEAGPIKTPQVTVPFYTARLNTDYQQIASIESRANSTYQAAMIKLTRYAGRGLSLRAHYLYAHATDWNPDESANVASNDVLDPQDFNLEYGTSNLDIRHSAATTLIFEAPWKLRGWAGQLTNAWSLSAVGQYRSGLPYTMRTSGYIPGFYETNHALVEGVGPGMNGSAGDNRVYGVGRNTYRYPGTSTGNARLGKRFNLANHRELELLAESFNLLNHQNVTRIETTGYYIDRGSHDGALPTLNFLTGLKAGTVEFGKPLAVNATSYYRQREIQLGIRARF